MAPYGEMYTSKEGDSAVSTPPIPRCKDRVELTGDRQWHIKDQSISRYDKEYLGNVPFPLPDMLYFLIEEDQPFVYLVVVAGRKRPWKTYKYLHRDAACKMERWDLP